MRLFLCLSLIMMSLSAQADSLYERLRILLPGDEPAVVNERQFMFRQIEQLFEEMERERRVHRKGPKKRSKRIREYLGEHVLVRYDAGATLTDLFLGGRYSDATVTALAALCLEKYEVPFDIYVDHWKSYVVARPKRREYQFYYGEKVNNEKRRKMAYRHDYLSMVRQTVQPSLPALKGDAAAAAFYSSYYRPGRSLGFKALAAYLQFVQAQTAYAKKDYPETIQRAEAALQLEDRAAFLVIREAARVQLNAAEKPTIEGDLVSLFDNWHAEPDNAYIPAAILQHFDEAQRLVLSSDEPKSTEHLVNVYLDRAPPGQETWRQQMRDLQQLRLLDHYFKSGRKGEARNLAIQLYNANPDDERLRQVLGEVLVDQLRRGTSTGPEFRTRMEVAASEFPFLRSHPRYIDLYLREQALTIRDLYAKERPDLASPALQSFRKSISDLAVGEDRSLWTLTAFAAASYYHFRIKDYQGAVDFIDEALQYAPDDQYLLHRKSVLLKYL